MKRWSIVVALLAIATVAAMPAFAGGNGKGYGKGGKTAEAALAPSISLDQDPTTLSVGSTVTFTYSAAGMAKDPQINAWCEQSGTTVWGETEWAAGNSFVLGSTFWSPWLESGGPAKCWARLFTFDRNDNTVVLATTDVFDVDG
jgi:hypothetical protein